ncbi:MAG: hypothetical protein ACR2PQ_08760 [Myxococcota bacterium]
MSSSVLLVVLAQASFALLLGTVGVRLLLLAARTRCAPELALGIGFVGVVVAIPLLGISGFGRGTVGEIRFPLLAVALFLLWISISSMTCFTWRTFRPAAAWAAVLTGGLTCMTAVILIGVWHGATHGDPATLSLAAAQPWVVWIRAPFALGLIWTGIEAFRQYGMARRRLALEIGDPVIVNRFLLWGFISAFTLLNNVVATLLQAQGRGPNNDPTAAFVLALGGIVGGGLVYLVFMPPEAWLRFVRTRAAA